MDQSLECTSMSFSNGTEEMFAAENKTEEELDPFANDADSSELTAMFPVATLKDFDDIVPEEEREFCLQRYSDLNKVKQARMHCTSCNKHLGLSAHNVTRLRMHPLLRTLMCSDCLEFYSSGEFDKGEDGSELYCRWCGQGGQVYCCSSCPTVFCAKCIKRNFGSSKIEDIESIDDWNCFLCSSKELWCHRAALWAARRYCVLKNKYTLTVSDPIKRLKFQKECQIDESQCCKKKMKLKTPVEMKKPIKRDAMKRLSSPLTVNKKSNIQPILNLENNTINDLVTPPPLKKLILTPKHTVIPKTPLLQTFPTSIPIQNCPVFNKSYPTVKAYSKKSLSRKTNNVSQTNTTSSYNGFVPYPPTISSVFGRTSYSDFIPNDRLNLSLENLTSGLDMSNIGIQNNENNVICTPDFPLPIEPLCEMTIDDDCSEVVPSSTNPPPLCFNTIEVNPLSRVNIDKNTTTTSDKSDDVQCLTPKPRLVPKPLSALMSPQPIFNAIPSMRPVKVIKMSEQDVSINKTTGGLRFRVDPSSLCTNKMYQLPDGRVFAVNSNPSMPGGFSASIVTGNQTNSVSSKAPVTKITVPTPTASRGRSRKRNSLINYRKPPRLNTNISNLPVLNPLKSVSSNQQSSSNENSNLPRSSDSIEWYSYNLYDAVDLVNYVSKKIHKIKFTPIGNLRTKTINEIKTLHHSLDQVLKISCQRFTEIRNNLNTEFKTWLQGKDAGEMSSDDDNVEITSFNKPNNNMSNSPIFIDENSNGSNGNNRDKDDVVHIDSVVCEVCPGSDETNINSVQVVKSVNTNCRKEDKTCNSDPIMIVGDNANPVDRIDLNVSIKNNEFVSLEQSKDIENSSPKIIAKECNSDINDKSEEGVLRTMLTVCANDESENTENSDKCENLNDNQVQTKSNESNIELGKDVENNNASKEKGVKENINHLVEKDLENNINAGDEFFFESNMNASAEKNVENNTNANAEKDVENNTNANAEKDVENNMNANAEKNDENNTNASEKTIDESNMNVTIENCHLLDDAKSNFENDTNPSDSDNSRNVNE